MPQPIFEAQFDARITGLEIDRATALRIGEAAAKIGETERIRVHLEEDGKLVITKVR